MFCEKLISRNKFQSRITVADYINVTNPEISPECSLEPVTTGIPAGGGVLTGIAVFTIEAALKARSELTPCILIRKETTPDDIQGIDASEGILTLTGGATSHAAVVARSMNKTCVVGATELTIDTEDGSLFAPHGYVVNAGDKISIDGNTGNVYLGEVTVLTKVHSKVKQALHKLLKRSNNPLGESLYLGRGLIDTLTDTIYIPHSIYPNLGSWTTDIRTCLSHGLVVYVDIEYTYDQDDHTVLSLGGAQLAPDPGQFLADEGLDTKVIKLSQKYKPNIHNFLSGNVNLVKAVDLLNLFGTPTAYTAFIEGGKTYRGTPLKSAYVLTSLVDKIASIIKK